MLESIDLGLIPYLSAHQKQLDLIEDVSQSSKEYLVFCSHPPVVTMGRASTDKDLVGWTGETIQVERGGKATYHGPEQTICYPILNLNKRDRDLHKLLRVLEDACIETLKHYSIHAGGKKEDATGVWVGDKKIASIGIAAKKWVSYHGIAININKDPLAFQGIQACGFSSSVMTSIEEIKEKEILKEEFQALFEEELRALLIRRYSYA